MPSIVARQQMELGRMPRFGENSSAQRCQHERQQEKPTSAMNRFRHKVIWCAASCAVQRPAPARSRRDRILHGSSHRQRFQITNGVARLPSRSCKVTYQHQRPPKMGSYGVGKTVMRPQYVAVNHAPGSVYQQDHHRRRQMACVPRITATACS